MNFKVQNDKKSIVINVSRVMLNGMESKLVVGSVGIVIIADIPTNGRTQKYGKIIVPYGLRNGLLKDIHTDKYLQ